MDVISDPDFSCLPRHVSALFDAAAKDSFFNLLGWYQLVAQHGIAMSWQPRIYANEDAGLVSIVPRDGGQLHSCCNIYTSEHALLLGDAEDNTTAAIHRLVADISRETPTIDLIVLSGLDRQHCSYSALLDSLRQAGFVCKPFRSWATFLEPTTGQNFSKYFLSRPTQLRNTFKRKFAKVKGLPDARFLLSRQDNVEDFITEYDQVYKKSWKRPEPFPTFIPNLIRLAGEVGGLRAGVFYLDGSPIAAQFWVVWAGRAFIFKLAYDSQYEHLSPGTLLTMKMIENIIQNDAPEEVNFGRGSDRYKSLWTSIRKDRFGIDAARPHSLRGLANAVRIRGASLRDSLLGRSTHE